MRLDISNNNSQLKSTTRTNFCIYIYIYSISRWWLTHMPVTCRGWLKNKMRKKKVHQVGFYYVDVNHFYAKLDFFFSYLHIHWATYLRTCLIPTCVITARSMYTLSNKNPSAWNFLSPEPEVACGTVAITIRVVSLLRIRGVSLTSIHYNQSHRVYINRRRQYICLIWN